MSWALWLAGAAILFLPGAYLVRAGKLKVVRVYLAACAVLAVCWVFGAGALLGEAVASWPKALFAMLLPSTAVLMIWTARRDRERVMGRPEDRDAIATAAVLYGATHTTEVAGDTSDGGGADSGGL